MPILSLPAAPAAASPTSGRRPAIAPDQIFGVAADAAVDTYVGAVATTGGVPSRFSIVGSTPFRIDPVTGALRVNGALPAPGPLIVTVRAANAAGGGQGTVTIQVGLPVYWANSLSLFANSTARVNAGS